MKKMKFVLAFWLFSFIPCTFVFSEPTGWRDELLVPNGRVSDDK